MKLLITLLYILFMSNVNSQIIIDIGEPVISLSTRPTLHTEERNNYEVKTFGNLIQLDFEENQIYSMVINTNNYFTIQVNFIDDTFNSLSEINLVCDCTYKKEGFKLIINF